MGHRSSAGAALAVLALFAIAVPATAQTDLPDVDPSEPEVGPFEEFDVGAILSDVRIQIAIGGLILAGGGWALLSIFGTRHVTADNALDNESRAALYETIQDEPGIHLRELAREEEMNVTATSWHLKKLEDVGLVRSRKLEGYKVFYLSEGGGEARRLGVARNALRNDNARRILRAVLDGPGTHQRGLAEDLDVNHATVRWHLNKLEDAGLLVRVDAGNRSRYYVSAEGLHAVDAVEAAPAS